MARRRIAAVAADFDDVIALLKTWNIIESRPPGALLQNARKIHSATYSLILWKFRLKRLPRHGSVFIDEIASDALQILPQVLMGYSKTASLLTRGIIENIFRHIYFIDHPVEFERMNRDAKWYMRFDDLCGYARQHPKFLEIEGKFDGINRLTSLYSELSAGVHGRTVRDLEMRTALRKIKYEPESGILHAKTVENCAASANFLIALFHFDKVKQFAEEDKRIVLRSMPRVARQVWSSPAS